MTKILKFDQDTPQRLDVYLRANFPQVSRNQIAKVITSGLVLVQNAKAKPSTKLHSGERISFSAEIFQLPEIEDINLDVIYEDDFCIVINKPSGVITHAKGAFSSEASVASFAKPRLASDIDPEGQNNRAGIVHRLDRGTSGVIIVAKTAAAQKYLNRQFSTRKVKKTYYALVKGRLGKTEAQINMPIERNPKQPSTFRPGANGRVALTQYLVIATNDKYSLLKVTPITGRTHQIRVHLRAINHPIVGDTVYGGEPADRLMLHAASIEVNLPNSYPRTFSAPLPKDFKKFIKVSKAQLAL